MNGTNYQQQAIQTESPVTDEVKNRLWKNRNCFFYLLGLINQAADIADTLKKEIFYGKESGYINTTGFPEAIYNKMLHGSAKQFLRELSIVRLIHAILGLQSETGEIVEALGKRLYLGQNLDVINFSEEAGDIGWYQSLLIDAVGGDLGVIQSRNIAKLRQRYPNAFTEFDAANRNLGAERNILENGAGDLDNTPGDRNESIILLENLIQKIRG